MCSPGMKYAGVNYPGVALKGLCQNGGEEMNWRLIDAYR